MAERRGIFDGQDPFVLAQDWLAEAGETEPNDPNAMQLATVDADGLPNVRTVLLKDIETTGDGGGAFVFFTNYGSAKGRELDASGKAAFVMYWKSLGRQVRARGLVEGEEGAAADAYYRSRALQSRIGAWASRQSQPLASREALMAEVARQTARHGTAPTRPPFWGGFRIRPLEIEFWANGAFRLHDRFRWRRTTLTCAWDIQRLHP